MSGSMVCLDCGCLFLQDEHPRRGWYWGRCLECGRKANKLAIRKFRERVHGDKKPIVLTDVQVSLIKSVSILPKPVQEVESQVPRAEWLALLEEGLIQIEGGNVSLTLRGRREYLRQRGKNFGKR